MWYITLIFFKIISDWLFFADADVGADVNLNGSHCRKTVAITSQLADIAGAVTYSFGTVGRGKERWRSWEEQKKERIEKKSLN